MSATLEKPKPGLVAALLIPFAIWIIASIVAVVLLVQGIQKAEEIDDDFARVDAGEDTTVELKEAGDYRIWIDTSDSFSRFDPDAMATITDPDGNPVTANPYGSSLTYNDLEAVLTFEAPKAGDYTFNVTEVGGSSTDGVQFAIGKGNPASQLFGAILLMMAIGGVGFLIALILMIVMLVKRGRSKRRIVQASLQSGGYGGGYGGGYPPQGGYGPPGGYPPPGGYQQPGSSW